MKHFILILFPILFFAQESNSINIHLATFKGNNELYQEFDEKYCLLGDKLSSSSLDKSTPIFVTNITKCNYLNKDEYIVSGYWYNKFIHFKVDNDNQIFLTKNLFETTSNELQETAFKEIKDLYTTLPEDKKDNILTNSLVMSSYYAKQKREELRNIVVNYKKYGIGVIDAIPVEDYYSTGAKFKVFNASSKTIKYITFNFYGKNAVKDKVLYRAGAYNASRKGIGPVEPYTSGAWEFDNVWLTDIVEYLTLTSMTIQYMDNTTKVIKMSDNLWFENYDEITEQYNELKIEE